MLTATMTILDYEQGFAVGGEIRNDTDRVPLALYSFWFSRQEVPGFKRAIFASLPELLKLADYPDEIMLVGKSPFFAYHNSKKEIVKKCKVYSPGTRVYPRRWKNVSGGSYLLAKDAMKRKTDIAERLV